MPNTLTHFKSTLGSFFPLSALYNRFLKASINMLLLFLCNHVQFCVSALNALVSVWLTLMDSK